MIRFLHAKSTYTVIAIAVIIFVAYMIHSVSTRTDSTLITTTVETGSVRQLVSISGVTSAKQSAELAFPAGGIVTNVLVETGSIVTAGDVLVTLDARTLYADRQNALAALDRARADLAELLEGPTGSAREVTSETVASKEAALATTKETEAQKVSNAYHALLSADLSAYSDDPNEDALPPTVRGTYVCDTEGVYTLEVFNSKADSGFSYRLSGLETGTYIASVEQPIALGTCGLRIQFNASSFYNNSVWHIDIPNKKSAQYTTYRNAHSLAITQANSAIELATQAVALVKADANNQNAPARSEAVIRAEAAVTQAEAQLARIDASISDRSLRAPFNGVITEIDILKGETVSTLPIVTLLGDNAFEVTARVPEIDISKIVASQTAEMRFDAQPATIVTGTVTFISPQATEIDGVAYYEAKIQFADLPSWMRSGLNADIEIITAQSSDVLRIPKRFLNQTATGYEVLVKRGNTTASTTIEVLLEGNDGFVAITGLTAGDTLLAP
ncbi:HlyD family efflux transporter periplasmic adaptor subunit [Candidatus Kaiserbacteria bacterium]|nr:HlyD family efflux transporter periplasmic adaptor subunit [Candidatus Kaiserbacteria bacterium]